MIKGIPVPAALKPITGNLILLSQSFLNFCASFIFFVYLLGIAFISLFFKNKFIAPLDDAIITGIYGSQRILNGKPRSPHYGIDFAGKLGTPIKAMANGVVTLAENDLYYTGATLIFDHGHGISTLYMHMDKIFVEEGDIVKQGDIIGTVGSSGRSTGPHLDIRLNWFGIKLDPSTIIDIKLWNKII